MIEVPLFKLKWTSVIIVGFSELSILGSEPRSGSQSRTHTTC